MHTDHRFLLFDSYFQHTCRIIPEKDVLEIDIIGTGCIAHLRRWWNDLFLLSYNSARNKGFYTSSHAMRIERFRQFRKYKHRIHPMSKFRNFWEFLILHVLILNKVLFRFTSTFIFDDLPMTLFYIGAFFELIIITDLYVNMKTGYIDNEAKKVVLDTKKSLLNFCTRKLFLHFASAIPLHWFMFLRYGADINCGLCKTNRFTCALKIISIFSLFRVYEMSTYWTHNCSLNLYFFKFLRIGAVGLVTMYQFYDLSDVVCLLVILDTGYVAQSSLMGVKAGLRYSAEGQLVSSANYVYSDTFNILKSLLLFSVGSKETVYYLDKLTSLIAYVIANVFFAWSILECFALVGSIMYSRDEIMKMKKNALNFLASAHLSNQLGSKVGQYFDMKGTRLKITEKQNELYRCLPEEFKEEAILSCYLKLVMRTPLFSDWPLPIIREMVLMLQKRVYLTNDIVTLAGARGEGLMIVDEGVLAVYSQNNTEVGHLIDGDYFGEMSLVTDNELCVSFVVAITNSTLLLLDKLHFRMLMKDYRKIFYDFKMKMKNQAMNKTLTDVDPSASASMLKGT